MRSQNTDRSLVSIHHNYRHVTLRHGTDHTWQRVLSHYSTGRVGVGKCKTVFTRRHYPAKINIMKIIWQILQNSPRKITSIGNYIPRQGHGDILMIQ